MAQVLEPHSLKAHVITQTDEVGGEVPRVNRRAVAGIDHEIKIAPRRAYLHSARGLLDPPRTQERGQDRREGDGSLRALGLRSVKHYLSGEERSRLSNMKEALGEVHIGPTQPAYLSPAETAVRSYGQGQVHRVPLGRGQERRHLLG